MNQAGHDQRLQGSVLVADDVDIMRVTCQRALEREGLEVVTVASGREALKALDLRRFEVAVLDIRMPGISGVELLKMIRGRGNPGEIILMTAYADAGVAEEALNFGASAILIKPFEDIRALVETVKNCLARVRLCQGNSNASQGLEPVLLNAGLLDEDQVARALAEATATGKSFRASVIALGLADEDEINWAVANFLDISYVRLTEEMLDHDLIKNFPPRLAREYRCIPLFKSGSALHLVTADPFQPGAVKAISEALEVEAVFALADEGEIQRLFTRFYGSPGVRPLADWANRMPALETSERASALAEILAAGELTEVGRLALEPIGRDSYNLEFKATIKARSE